MVLISIILLALSLPCLSKDYVITRFGAKTSSLNNTKAIQSAIDKCSAQGGGRVVVPTGVFTTGTLIFKSNVNLFLEDGAVLCGSRSIADYPDIRTDFKSFRTNGQMSQLLYADNVENISITGDGTIDGQGDGFYHEPGAIDEGITRPHILQFVRCRNVLIRDVTMKNSACWMQHFLACENLRIENINVFNHNNFNNDAIDVDACKNVIITGCNLDSDDDAITFKSTCDLPCENVIVSNCVISSHCNGIKMGTETNGGFINFAISNCVIKPSMVNDSKFFGEYSGNGGIALEIVDGGVMDGITISNITIYGPLSPIFIRLGNRGRTYHPDQTVVPMGSMRNIMLDNINIRTAYDTGCSITGIPNFPVENVKLSNITIEQGGGLNKNYVYNRIPEMIAHYPDGWMFGKLPAYGLFVRHVKNITFDNVDMMYAQDDARPALFLSNVEGAKVSNSKMEGCQASECAIVVKQSKDIYIYNNIMSPLGSVFTRVIDEQSSNIQLKDNILPKDCIETTTLQPHSMSVVKVDVSAENLYELSAINTMFERLRVPFVPLAYIWQGNPTAVKSSVRVAYSDSEIYLQFNITEDKLKAIYTCDDTGFPSNDCCVEFFVATAPDKPYTNFEFNGIGTCLMERGMNRRDRVRLPKDITSKIRRESTLGVAPFAEKSGDFSWMITVAIPFELFVEPELLPLDGKSLFANFFKCAGDISTPHWLAWSPIHTLTPAFHEPQFFGKIDFINE